MSPITLSDWVGAHPFHPGAYVDAAAMIGPRTTVGAGAVIGANVTVGADCIIKPGAVIGQDGFGYTQEPDGSWTAKPHEYGVVIEDDVHIGANTCIDRGSWRNTTVQRGARIDNLVHVAHNAQIGRNVVLVAQAEVSGSAIVEDGAWIGPKACVMQRLTVGARALVGMGAVVLKDVPGDQTWAGNPARCLNADVGVRAEM
jgi:UDP-3-O-[3-hydroxymyristoyl] glucosamine N-acyltransferase